jgi:hypothetical protein
MTSHQRTLAALGRRLPDRTPVFCFCDQTSPGASDAFRAHIRTHADVFYTRVLPFGFQCTGLDPARVVEPLDDGWVETTWSLPGGVSFSETSKAGRNADYVGYRKHLLETEEDLERVLALPFVPPASNPLIDAWLRELSSFAARACSDGAFFRIAFLGPLGCLAGAVNPADFALLNLEHADLVRRYMDTVLERQAECLEVVLPRLGVPAIMNIGGAEYAIPPLMGPTAFRELVEPYDGRLIELVHRHGLQVYYHCHGKVRQFLPRFIAMGADGIHPLEPVGTTGDCDLAEVKKEFGKDICLIGNLQYDDLVRGTPEEIDRLVQDAAAAAAHGGGFILSPSCTPYHNPLPASVERNIMRFVDAGLRYGAA